MPDLNFPMPPDFGLRLEMHILEAARAALDERIAACRAGLANAISVPNPAAHPISKAKVQVDAPAEPFENLTAVRGPHGPEQRRRALSNAVREPHGPEQRRRVEGKKPRSKRAPKGQGKCALRAAAALEFLTAVAKAVKIAGGEATAGEVEEVMRREMPAFAEARGRLLMAIKANIRCHRDGKGKDVFEDVGNGKVRLTEAGKALVRESRPVG